MKTYIPSNNTPRYPSAQPRDAYSLPPAHPHSPTNNKSRVARKSITHFQRYLARHRVYRSRLHATPPAPRLVGVETNPGPPKTKAVTVVKTIAKGSSRRRRRRPTGASRVVSQMAHSNRTQRIHQGLQRPQSGSLASYARALLDPWNAPSVRLGFGSFVPTAIRTASLFSGPSMPATANCFAVLGTCYVANHENNDQQLTVPAFISTYHSNIGTEVLGIHRFGNQAAVNAASINNALSSSRVISGAMRVTVRYAATAVRGSLTILYLPDTSFAQITNMTFNELVSLQSGRRCNSTAGGEIAGEIQYRPVDATSFEFSTDMTRGTLGLEVGIPLGQRGIPIFVAVGSGWVPGSFQIEISQVVHYEGVAGVESYSDGDGSDSLAASGVTIDQVGQSLSAMGDPVLTNSAEMTSIELAMHGFANANRARAGNGPSSSSSSSFTSALGSWLGG